jgi:hypothetical protein
MASKNKKAKAAPQRGWAYNVSGPYKKEKKATIG